MGFLRNFHFQRCEGIGGLEPDGVIQDAVQGFPQFLIQFFALLQDLVDGVLNAGDGVDFLELVDECHGVFHGFDQDAGSVGDRYDFHILQE
ncbi:hypothetical protein SDC9_160663 [bioreactor metagenome]|uniref:Uncharacterized protein n=1 Tax=bioreactor metagenome TaxID=1076179 RepID=A0A645FII7_9ZZZZ